MRKPCENGEHAADNYLNFMKTDGSVEVYHDYCEDLRMLIDALYVGFLEFNIKNKTVSVKALSGNKSVLDEVYGLVGFDLREREWDIIPEKLAELRNGGLVAHKSLFDYCMGVIPRKAADDIESRFEIGCIYSHAVPCGETTIYEFFIVMPRWEKIAKPGVVSLFSSYVGTIIVKLRTEEKLIQSESRYRQLAETAGELILTHTCEGEITYINRAGCEMLGMTEEEIKGRNLMDLVSPCYHDKILDTRNKRVNCGDAERITCEVGIVNRHGQEFIVDMSSTPVIKDGLCRGSMVIGRDITSRKKFETKLRLQSAALEATAFAVMITDLRGNVEWVNPSFARITGYPFGEVHGRNVSSFKFVRQEKELFDSIWAVVSEGSVWRGEIAHERKSGGQYTAQMVIAPVYDDSNTVTHYVTVLQDITAQKTLQEKVYHMQRMEGIGRMSSGVAHDFNNILGIILGYATLIEESSSACPDTRQKTDIIKAMVERGSKLARQILTFAKRRVINKERVCLNDFIKEISQMIGETFPRNIEISLTCGATLPEVMVDRGQLHQVFLNLAMNARDAIVQRGVKKGVIKISTELITNGGIQYRYPEAEAGSYAVIRVKDNGIGMDKQTIRKIYDPFFTTKESEGGSGLGLPVAYGIIRSHNGFIDVESTPGAGSTFSVYLPLSLFTDPEISKDKDSGNEPRSYAGTETVLLVEDETMMLNILSKILKRKGYNVITASDGSEAYALYKSNTEKIDIIISDQGMPLMSGFELYKKIALYHGRAPFIMISGYIGQDDRSLMLKAGVSAILQKPCPPDVVLSTVRSLLDGEKVVAEA